MLTLTVAEIVDLAIAAGLVINQKPMPDAGEMKDKFTIIVCPTRGVRNNGKVSHYAHVAYMLDYPEKGIFPLGPEVAPGKNGRYSALDDAICRHIANGCAEHPTKSEKILDIARKFLINRRTPFQSSFRLIENRMRAMREAGRLVYERANGEKGAGHGRWRVVE
jgi:hypothetical protein